jgi:hypothetical protein
MTSADADAIDMAVDCVAGLLGGSVTDAQVIKAGGNNRIVRVDQRGELPRAVKIYFRHPDDKRDRLATEFGALSFLWRHGVRRTPQPLATDPDRGVAIYSFIEGTRIAPADISREDIAAAVRMLQILRDHIGAEGAQDFGPASEAVFSLDGLLSNLRDRYKRHLAVDGSDPIFCEYQTFRDGPLIRALDIMEQAARVTAARVGEAGDKEIPQSMRILSASDFGFHNAIRRPSGDVIFLDFEYFGWDDPAKTVCDFCYHPAMVLTPQLRRLFAASAIPLLGGAELAARVGRLFPIFGLKWCIILLNEFLPEGRLRRGLASGRSSNGVLAVQLEKARAMLERVMTERERDGFADNAS